jgi:hypothetical protein
MNDIAKKSAVGYLLLVTGGVIIAGALLAWFTVATGAIGFEGGTVSDSYTGLEAGPMGIAALLAGGAVVVAGLLWLVTRSGRTPSIIAVLGGVLAAGIAAFQVIQIDSAFVDAAASNASNEQLPQDKISDLLSQLIDGGEVTVDPGIGLWLVLAGGLLAIVLGLVGVVRAGRSSQPQAEAPTFTVPTDT